MKSYLLSLLFCILLLFLYLSYKMYKNNNSNESYNSNKSYNSNESYNPLITFIIPSIGRNTLPRTLDSLKNMKNKNWNAIVVFDGIDPNINETDKRIKIIKLDKKQGEGRNYAGKVRNYGIKFAQTPWVGFVDDDDTLNEDYIDKLIEHINNEPNLDSVIFRMKYKNGGKILPKVGDIDFKNSEVGISFCLKTELTKDFNFVPSPTEDFDLLNKLRSNNKKIIISDYIGYNVY